MWEGGGGGRRKRNRKRISLTNVLGTMCTKKKKNRSKIILIDPLLLKGKTFRLVKLKKKL